MSEGSGETGRLLSEAERIMREAKSFPTPISIGALYELGQILVLTGEAENDGEAQNLLERIAAVVPDEVQIYGKDGYAEINEKLSPSFSLRDLKILDRAFKKFPTGLDIIEGLNIDPKDELGLELDRFRRMAAIVELANAFTKVLEDEYLF